VTPTSRGDSKSPRDFSYLVELLPHLWRGSRGVSRGVPKNPVETLKSLVEKLKSLVEKFESPVEKFSDPHHQVKSITDKTI
jgi:hypothetical protein